MNDALMAYLAGCLDCDGSFGIYRNTSIIAINNHAYSPLHQERIIFKQVKPDVVNLLYETLGGRKTFEPSHNPNHKSIYGWTATNIQAINCINKVLPYLRVKKPQALILLELHKRKQGNKSRGKRLSQAEITYRDTLHSQIKMLNDVRNHKVKLFHFGTKPL
jgi:hypothetical protein